MLSFDLYGNLYLNINDKMYQLCFDRNNNPVFESGEYPVIDQSTIDINELKHDRLHRETVQQSDMVYEEETEESDIIDEDHVRMYGEDNKKFKFSGSDFEIANRDIINALYDTHVYSNDILVFKSESATWSSIYLVELYDNTQLKVGNTTYDVMSLLPPVCATSF